MAQNNLLKILLDGTAPKNLRMLVARGSAPLPVKEMLELLVCLLKDPDSEVSASAAKTIGSWDERIAGHLQASDCGRCAGIFCGYDATDAVLQSHHRQSCRAWQIINNSHSRLQLNSEDSRQPRPVPFPAILEASKIPLPQVQARPGNKLSFSAVKKGMRLKSLSKRATPW
jgi:hypothetical protein